MAAIAGCGGAPSGADLGTGGAGGTAGTGGTAGAAGGDWRATPTVSLGADRWAGGPIGGVALPGRALVFTGGRSREPFCQDGDMAPSLVFDAGTRTWRELGDADRSHARGRWAADGERLVVHLQHCHRSIYAATVLVDPATGATLAGLSVPALLYDRRPDELVWTRDRPVAVYRSTLVPLAPGDRPAHGDVPSMNLPGIVGYASAASDGERVYVAGEERPSLAVADPAAGTARALPPPPFAPRKLVWTGRRLLGVRTDTGEVASWDPTSGTWHRAPPSPLSPRNAAPVVWTGRELVILGGTGPDAGGTTPGTTPGTTQGTSPGPGTTSGTSPGTTGTTGTTPPVPPGVTGSGGELLDGAAYDPDADAWIPLPALPDVGAPWRRAVVLDGEVLAWTTDAAGVLHGATLDLRGGR